MPHCLRFIVKSGSSPQGRIWEKKVRTLVCIHFCLCLCSGHVCTNLGALEKFYFELILTLECINMVKLTQYSFQIFFYNIVEFLDMLVGHRFRNAALYHCKESMNYPKLWFVTKFLLFLKKDNSLFVNRFNVFSKEICPNLIFF